MRTSILVLACLVGVSSGRHISYYDNESYVAAPMVTGAQERRICAELCMAGLGGEPCGADCLDVIPQGLPVAYAQSDGDRPQVDYRRRDACPLLCENRLGYPLCECNYTAVTTPFFKVDFVSICEHFCTAYQKPYRIYGCHECSEYQNMTSEPHLLGRTLRGKQAYDWNQWCVQMCQEGDGGSACNCDRLPMMLRL